ncbi:MAG: cytochrome P450 [Pseudomonadota bacterium]
MSLPRIRQSPRDPEFVQNPYPFYESVRALGPLFIWQDYDDLPCTGDHALVNAVLRDRRFGREPPPDRRPPAPPHLAPFRKLDDLSMLDREPPAHTRLRGLVVRAFTSARVAALEAEISALAHRLIDAFPADQPFDLLPAFAEPLPARIIARLIGVPEDAAPQLVAWSHAMVAMYQARRDTRTERAAGAAAAAFDAYLRDLIAARRKAPAGDLLSALIAARDDADRLSEDEIVATTVLLLNAGHEATVHSLGNAIPHFLAAGLRPSPDPEMVEEVLRYDPPLHLFTRWVNARADLAGHRFEPGDQIGLLLAAANRDPAVFEMPDRFDPTRAQGKNLSFGAGIHFCVGAPLARAEIRLALPILLERCPGLRVVARPEYRDIYHFRGRAGLRVAI